LRAGSRHCLPASLGFGMDLFESQWHTYRAVVDNDWMEHRALTAACVRALQSWMAADPERQGRARLVDLGCGDLALMAPEFRALPLGSYVGVDLTEQVLPMARAALQSASFPSRFVCADVTNFIESTDEEFDLVHAALVLHHLRDDDKVRFLSTLRERIRPGGVFLWADVFCEPGESRPDYAARYAERIRRDWREIGEEEREAVVTHMCTYDFPADRVAIVAAAKQAGWRWEWLWQGHHHAEAVALLTLG
jgi:SAM-dependent methyltransferase